MAGAAHLTLPNINLKQDIATEVVALTKGLAAKTEGHFQIVPGTTGLGKDDYSATKYATDTQKERANRELNEISLKHIILWHLGRNLINDPRVDPAVKDELRDSRNDRLDATVRHKQEEVFEKPVKHFNEDILGLPVDWEAITQTQFDIKVRSWVKFLCQYLDQSLDHEPTKEDNIILWLDPIRSKLPGAPLPPVEPPERTGPIKISTDQTITDEDKVMLQNLALELAGDPNLARLRNEREEALKRVVEAVSGRRSAAGVMEVAPLRDIPGVAGAANIDAVPANRPRVDELITSQNALRKKNKDLGTALIEAAVTKLGEKLEADVDTHLQQTPGGLNPIEILTNNGTQTANVAVVMGGVARLLTPSSEHLQAATVERNRLSHIKKGTRTAAEDINYRQLAGAIKTIEEKRKVAAQELRDMPAPTPVALHYRQIEKLIDERKKKEFMVVLARACGFVDGTDEADLRTHAKEAYDKQLSLDQHPEIVKQLGGVLRDKASIVLGPLARVMKRPPVQPNGTSIRNSLSPLFAITLMPQLEDSMAGLNHERRAGDPDGVSIFGNVRRVDAEELIAESE